MTDGRTYHAEQFFFLLPPNYVAFAFRSKTRSIVHMPEKVWRDSILLRFVNAPFVLLPFSFFP